MRKRPVSKIYVLISALVFFFLPKYHIDHIQNCPNLKFQISEVLHGDFCTFADLFLFFLFFLDFLADFIKYLLNYSKHYSSVNMVSFEQAFTIPLLMQPFKRK